MALPKRVVIGCSGGLDSTVLVDSLVRYRPDLTVILAHVNYSLREESNGDADFVRALAEKQDLRYFEKQADLSDLASGVEEAARKIRYDFFEAVKEEVGADAILLAHHQDDQVETILLQVIRGGLLQKKTGMAVKQGHYLRPFLGLSKASLKDYAEEQGLTWREDVTNQDPDYTGRNQLRQVVVPALTKINPKAKEHLLALAEQLGGAEALIEERAKELLPAFCQDYESVPSSWWPALLKEEARQAGLFKLTEAQLKAMVRLLKNEQKPQGRIDLAESFSFQKSYRRVAFVRLSQEKKKSVEKIGKDGQQAGSLVLELDQWYFWQGLCLGVRSVSEQESGENRLLLPADYVGPLTLERAKVNDRIPLNGGSKTVRRLLIDEKIPAEERPQTDLLKDREKNVLAVFLGQKRWYYTRFWPKDRPSGKQSLVWRIEEN